jgi:hypothetical protein
MKMRKRKKKQRCMGDAWQVGGEVVGDRAAAAHPKELAICPFLWPIRQRIGWGTWTGRAVNWLERTSRLQVVQEGSAQRAHG